MSEIKKIDARPTKEFFITMLTRDIGLTRAILDLVDNSVDAVRKLDNDSHQKEIRIKANSDYFKIQDNCGGIEMDTASNYAFRFGRPSDVEPDPHSVGLFGVGMKRAIFKLGTKFKVESQTKSESFIVQEDIEKWKVKEEWEFDLNEIDPDKTDLDTSGTIVIVENLYQQVKEEFSDENFLIKLGNEIKDAHLDAINDGLKIFLNDNELETEEFSVLVSEDLIPGYERISMKVKSDSPITAKIITGINEPIPSEAGWYIFCNKRLVLDADRSFLTGWGEGNGRTVPNYHNDFSRFRGFVYLESEDPRELPWNTTKTGVDANSPIYKTIRNKMITDMKPVISFLRELRKEKSNENVSETIIQDTIEDAHFESIKSINKQQKFKYPEPSNPPRKKKIGRISYSKPIEEINKVKKKLDVTTYKEVGELTFEYFFNIECE